MSGISTCGEPRAAMKRAPTVHVLTSVAAGIVGLAAGRYGAVVAPGLPLR